MTQTSHHHDDQGPNEAAAHHAHGQLAERTPDRNWRVVEGDCLDVLANFDSATIDAVVTDPPYGIGFQGNAWDRPADHYQQWCEGWVAECLRILKPGGHLVSFGAPRTAHHLASGIEDAGFEIRDTLMWLYGQGFPKSRNLTGVWQGWGTTLKPAYEPIILARKPLAASHIQHSVERYGTGALHIDGCRDREGRWPPNVILTHDPTCRGERCAAGCPVAGLGDRARYFYCAKANRRERERGCEQLDRRVIDTFKIGAENEQQAKERPVANYHPTVKPIELMRWLIRLVTVEGGLVLDPFCGSGSTGCGAMLESTRFLGIERDLGYVRIARARIAHTSSIAERAGERAVA